MLVRSFSPIHRNALRFTTLLRHFIRRGHTVSQVSHATLNTSHVAVTIPSTKLFQVSSGLRRFLLPLISGAFRERNEISKCHFLNLNHGNGHLCFSGIAQRNELIVILLMSFVSNIGMLPDTESIIEI